ncbi:MAG: DUF47 family protein [Desulfurococcaceae archaeon]
MKIPMGKFIEEILDKMRNHTLIASESIDILGRIVKEYHVKTYDELQKLFEELMHVEKKGDEIKRELMSCLRAGHLHPEDREDLLRIALVLDEIPGLAKAVAKKILVFKHINISIPVQVQKYVAEIVDNSKKCIESLVRVAEHFPHEPQKVMEYATEAEHYEEVVDELRLKALEDLFKLCMENFGVQCIALHIVIDDAETITDRCEDVADIYRLNLISR